MLKEGQKPEENVVEPKIKADDFEISEQQVQEKDKKELIESLEKHLQDLSQGNFRIKEFIDLLNDLERVDVKEASPILASALDISGTEKAEDGEGLYLYKLAITYYLLDHDRENVTRWMEKILNQVMAYSALGKGVSILSAALHSKEEAKNHFLEVAREFCNKNWDKKCFLIKNFIYAATDDIRDHPLYFGQEDSFFEEGEKGSLGQFKIRQMKKDGSFLYVLGGSLVGKAIIRVITGKALKSWKKAYEAKEFWKEKGFDYVPVEAICEKRGELRFKKEADDSLGKADAQIDPFKHGYYRVFTKVMNKPLVAYSMKMDWENDPEFKKLFEQKDKISQALQELGIIHGHLHVGNFCVEEDPETKKPRVYVIDFDQAVDENDPE